MTTVQWYYAIKAAQRHTPPALGHHPGVFLILVVVGKHEPNKQMAKRRRHRAVASRLDDRGSAVPLTAAADSTSGLRAHSKVSQPCKCIRWRTKQRKRRSVADIVRNFNRSHLTQAHCIKYRRHAEAVRNGSFVGPADCTVGAEDNRICGLERSEAEYD
jgi:hypothetical protein